MLSHLKAGPGIFKWHTGETYEGSFADGLANGKGVHTFPSGDVCAGTFKNGLVHGLGKVDILLVPTIDSSIVPSVGLWSDWGGL